MTQAQKTQFVRNLTASIRDEVCRAICNSPDLVEHWDGHELRSFLADKFAHEETALMKRGRRRNEYKRTAAEIWRAGVKA